MGHEAPRSLVVAVAVAVAVVVNLHGRFGHSPFLLLVPLDALLVLCLPSSQPLDTSNFDEDFTSLPAVDTPVEDSDLSQSVQRKFEGFSFVDENELVASP